MTLRAADDDVEGHKLTLRAADDDVEGHKLTLRPPMTMSRATS